MSLIGNLISEIEVGAIDLDRCLSTYHELSDDEKFLLALADRKSRFKRGEGYTIESYLQRLPWVADKPSLLQQMILDEFGFRLGSVDSAKLADELCSRHPGLGADLESQVRERLDQWNATLLSKAEFDALCDRFEEAVTEKQSPVIEDWLHLAPFASRVDLLRELLLIESYHIAESGSQPDWVQYHSRFPEYFELIEEVRVHQDEALRSRSRIDGATSNGENAFESSNFSAPFIRRPTASDSQIEQKEDFRYQGINSPTDAFPESFGRYRVSSVLGKGGFGVVYHARDVQLERDVALKVIQGASLGVSIRQSFLTEAQIVAALDHPNIVPVYDVGQNDDGNFFVVSKLIDGSDLSKRIKLNRPDRLLALRIVEQIAEALNYSHAKGLVHRDVKPGNILLDRQDRPYLADFGLALRETEERKQGDPLGTPAYMSPEQARGDGKRVDHRSDIYSLGVVLYELLTGRRPFFSDNVLNLIRLVATEDVRSPRVFDGTIPQKLERVCLKALARHASERYTIAGDFAEDIRWVINQPSLIPANVPSASVPSGELATQSPSTPRTGPTRVVPKGLRSFEAADADFFLELLPGPFDRDGLPESLRFWKTRIEETEPEHTFKVGVMYGPSGCGKSSLMKAGLLPRLSAKITAIYAEASGDDTEARLLRVIRRRVPDAEGESLKEILSVIRRRKLVPTGGKLLIVIDQFEQWLFAEKDYAKSSLTDALFQCDGGTIQAVVLVREEFWSSVSRFFRELDIPLADCENSALVDLFDLEHATNVLGLFGRAFEKIPDSRKDWSDDQREFINKSIEGLSEDRKVIPVRIAVFADMMRSRPWTTAALREIGGTEGVGFTFLEEMFGSKHAPVQHRQHQEAVRGVLSALLPDVGTDIKGAMQSADALQTAAGYERKPREFQELLGILDKNLRLITPVDEFVDDGGDNSETPESRIQSRSYQLAHDYLVPSLRSWLTQKQRETKKGRAELKLAERAAAWSSNKESKHYPTLLEWLQIRLRTDKAQWSNSERLLMRAAGRKHAIYWGNSIAAFAVLTAMTAYLFHQQHLRNQKAIIIQALNSLQVALGRGVSTSIRSLHELGQSGLIRSELERRYANANESSEKILLAFGLAAFGQVESNYLGSQIDEIDNRDLANLIDALGQDPAKSIESLKRLARQCNAEELYRRKARLALAAFALGDDDLPIDASEFEGRTDHGLRTCFIDEFPRWYLETDATRQAVQDSASPALRSAICLALGQIAANRISRKDKARVAQLATKWFSLPDSSTHSAVSWLLRQWDLPEPQLADARQMIEGRNWFVNSQGLTFVRISATPVAVEPDNVLNPGPSYYWLANREVTRSEFEVFVNDSSYAGPKPLTETVRHITQESADSTNGHPIADVSWYEAVIYCNWLSVHEGREPAYRSVGKETVETARDGEIEVDKWEMEKNADGYRLPTESQWEYACRAGTATDWSQGNDKLLLAAYCQMWPSDFVLPCGEKLPNAWGLHDMHGNVSEWCWNLWEKSSSNRAFRGGGWSSRASDWRSANRNWAVPSDRGDFLGFRLLLGPSVK